SRPRREFECSTSRERTSTRRRSRSRRRMTSTSDASGATRPIRSRTISGSSATRSSRAQRSTPCRSPSGSFSESRAQRERGVREAERTVSRSAGVGISMTRRLAEGIEGSEADPIDADAERERAGGEPAPRRILLSIAYDGTDACGWQIQPDVRTIQGDLERAVAKVCGEPSHVDGTSRTDAGVHALGQSAAITTYRPTPAERIPRALNGVLPADIRVLAAREVPLEF